MHSQLDAIFFAPRRLPVPDFCFRIRPVRRKINPSCYSQNRPVLSTRSSKSTDGKPSIVETAHPRFRPRKYIFDLTASKDGRIFDSKEFHEYAAVIFFTTGDLTQEGTDKNPPMSAQGKQAFLDAIQNGMGFVGIHAATDTFHTPPDTQDLSNRYIAHGEQSDPYLQMIGGEFIIHGQDKDPRLQTANVIINDPEVSRPRWSAISCEFDGRMVFDEGFCA